MSHIKVFPVTLEKPLSGLWSHIEWVGHTTTLALEKTTVDNLAYAFIIVNGAACVGAGES